MQKVITINLNGNAYQIDEAGYAALVAYLEGAERSLKDNPDRAEILADLEQAIADKCRRFLGPHKTVVTAAEVDQIIREMGPVDGPAPRTRRRRRLGAQGLGRSRRRRRRAATALPDSRGRDARRRLQRARGLSAHRRHDRPDRVPAARAGDSRRLRPRVPRARLRDSAGRHIGANGPPRTASRSTRGTDRSREIATTPASRAARTGVVDGAGNSARGGSSGAAIALAAAGGVGLAPPAPGDYGTRIVSGAMVPILSVLSVLFFWFWAWAVYSLVTTGQVLGQALPDDIPFWVGILVLVCVYHAVAWPLHFARRRAAYYSLGGQYGGFIARVGRRALADVRHSRGVDGIPLHPRGAGSHQNAAGCVEEFRWND